MFDTWIGLSYFDVLALEPPGWGAQLLAGLWRSLVIASGAYTLALLIGVAGACGKLYGGELSRDFLEVYTTLVRAVPELVLILLLYYAGTQMLNHVLAQLGYPPVDINALAAGIAVLGIVLGAYMVEVIRGAIQSIPPGQVEAGRAFGMGPFKLFWRIVFPAMLPHALPGLGNYWLAATRDTALLAVVGFMELTMATRTAAGSTRHYMTFYLTTGAIYLVVSIISSIIIKLIEIRYRRGMVRPVS
jgi:polar amino acid transport system permease protein